jgi:hypothetical protein
VGVLVGWLIGDWLIGEWLIGDWLIGRRFLPGDPIQAQINHLAN